MASAQKSIQHGLSIVCLNLSQTKSIIKIRNIIVRAFDVSHRATLCISWHIIIIIEFVLWMLLKIQRLKRHGIN